MDLQFIKERYYSKILEHWMKGTRFERLYMLDRCLDGTLYDEIPLAFSQEKNEDKSYNTLAQRRPSIKHNFPAFIAGLCARKLFAGRHTPRFKHENREFLLKVQALIEELHLPKKMLEAVKRGSVGSVCIMFKFLASPIDDSEDAETVVKGVVEVKRAQYCTPCFNKFNELTGVLEHYIVSGSDLLARNIKMYKDLATRPGEILSDRKYWFVKLSDNNMECIYYPFPEQDWNPVNGGRHSDSPNMGLTPYPELTVEHNLGFVQAVWIENLTGGCSPDGLSTFEPAMDNFIQIDYAKSQNGQGLIYGAAPQLVIKGDLRDEVDGNLGIVNRAPSYMIRLAADEKSMDQTASSGHDAFLLETNGAAAKASDDYVNSLKHTSFEQICTARKDLESIKGTMSGKVIELIDEDFLDLLEEQHLNYGDDGYLPLTKKLCKAASMVGHKLMADVSDELIDGLLIDYPPMYLPDAQEIQFLISGFVEATATQEPGPTTKSADGSSKQEMLEKEPLIDPKLAAAYLAKQLDLVEDSDDKPVISETEVSQDGLPTMKPEEPSDMGGNINEATGTGAEGLVIHALKGGAVNSGTIGG